MSPTALSRHFHIRRSHHLDPTLLQYTTLPHSSSQSSPSPGSVLELELGLGLGVELVPVALPSSVPVPVFEVPVPAPVFPVFPVLPVLPVVPPVFPPVVPVPIGIAGLVELGFVPLTPGGGPLLVLEPELGPDVPVPG